MGGKPAVGGNHAELVEVLDSIVVGAIDIGRRTGRFVGAKTLQERGEEGHGFIGPLFVIAIPTCVASLAVLLDRPLPGDTKFFGPDPEPI